MENLQATSLESEPLQLLRGKLAPLPPRQATMRTNNLQNIGHGRLYQTFEHSSLHRADEHERSKPSSRVKGAQTPGVGQSAQWFQAADGFSPGGKG